MRGCLGARAEVVTVMAVPWSSERVETEMVSPLCFSTMPLVTQSPRPVPTSALVVKNGSNRRDRSSSIPEPYPRCVIAAPSPSRFTEIRIMSSGLACVDALVNQVRDYLLQLARDYQRGEPRLEVRLQL